MNTALESVTSQGLLLVLGALGALALVQFLRHWAEAKRRQIQRETQRNVMAAVMDSQNNFLNNIVYFHTRAEAGGTMSTQELGEIETAIRTAQDRLIEIANSEPPASRLLGRPRAYPKAKQHFAGG